MTHPAPPETTTTDQSRATILIVSPDGSWRQRAGRVTASLAHETITYSNGRQALEYLEEREAAVIVSDLVLPDMDGIDLLRRVSLLWPIVQRILRGTHHDPEVMRDAINLARITAYLPEPIEDEVTIENIERAVQGWQDESTIQSLNTLICSQHQQLSKTHQAVREEMRLVANIHSMLLAGEVPEHQPDLTIASFSVPNRDITGDFFDFYQPSDYDLDLVFGDVMGKGLPAALVGTAVKAQLTRVANPIHHTTHRSDSGPWESTILSPEAILDNVRQTLVHSLIELGFFTSLFYGRFSLRQRCFIYVDCGAPKPIVIRRKTQEVLSLSGRNFPLGMIEDDSYQQVEIPFEAGDLFLFFSDGVTETRDPTGTLFGEDRLIKWVKEHSSLPPNQLINLLVETITSFSEKETFDDDVTLIAVRCNAASVAVQSSVTSMTFSSCLDQLPAVRQFIAQQCDAIPGDTESLSSQLQLAVNEVFCNIAKHGYGNNKGPVLISISREREGVRLEIADRSPGFQPALAPLPDLSGEHDSGYGFYIVQAIADELCYHRTTVVGGWNRLEIFKHYQSGQQTMNLQHRSEGDVLIVTIESDNLDAREAGPFRKSLVDLVESENKARLVLDLGQLQFIDSSGLGSLLSVLRHLNGREGDLKLANMNASVRALFEIVRMHKLFEIFQSPADAVQSYQ